MSAPDTQARLRRAIARGDADDFAAVLIAEPLDGAFFSDLIRHGRTGRATAYLRLGLMIDPAAAPLLSRLGDVVFGMEDFDGCATLLLRMAHLETLDKAVQNRAVAALFQVEDLARAERRARRSVTLDPDDPEAWFWLGRVLRAGARHAEARAALAESAKRDPVFAIRVRIVEQGVGPADFAEDDGAA